MTKTSDNDFKLRLKKSASAISAKLDELTELGNEILHYMASQAS